MAEIYRPGIYSQITAMARRIQIKSQITKGHLCAWLDNRMRLKQLKRLQAVTYRADTGDSDKSLANIWKTDDEYSNLHPEHQSICINYRR